ncbi:MAG: cation diffusion facilitator family transporter [Candidatus Caenarcaniphilales bacterium]|nr:cation diffusion facilitator family transporter [Candidatus Caenarcaniphilales bacterium]
MSNKVKKAAFSSALAAVFLTVIKLIVGLKTNSIGILAEATHSAVDLVAALVTLWAVKLSAVPADRDHHFGHGKVENLAALFETVLLWGTCLWITWEAGNRLLGHSNAHIESGIWAIGVIIISIVVDITRSRELNRVAKEHNSQALAADALHFQTDAYSSAAVLLGLICSLSGFVIADAIAAMGVVIWTFILSIKLAKESFDQLMDKAPAGLEEKLSLLIKEVGEVKVISSLKVRQSGPNTFIDLTIGLDKKISLEIAHQITDLIEEKIKQEIPNSVISIHPEPS